MANIIDDIKETIDIDEEYTNKIKKAHNIAEKIYDTKFEIGLLNVATEKNLKK
jgi:hypothetical protein